MVSYLPAGLQEALEIRASTGAIPYGGGTDLMVNSDADASYLFLHKVPEMRRITVDEQNIRIGAACTFTETAESPLCPDILKDAIAGVAAPAIRNLGTVGGNLGNGSAKADCALIFFVTGAELRLMSVRGERFLSAKAFYLGQKKLALAPDELIVEVLMPRAIPGRYYYRKVGAREALSIARVSFAGLMDIRDGVVANCATAFGAVSDVILRREDIDAMLTGRTVAEAKALKADYVRAYDAAIQPIRGRVSADYRRAVCLNLLRDFLDTMGI